MDASKAFGPTARQFVALVEDSLLGSRPDDDRIRVLGHRGAPASGIVENSAASVTEALLLGADGVEIDVWLASDGTLVCTHDLGSAPVATLSTLTEVLAAVQLSAGFQVVVEAKPVSDAAVAQKTADVLAEVLRTDAGTADITVSSFDPLLLAMIRASCADLPVRTALLADKSAAAAAVVRRASEDGHDEVHLPFVAVRRSPEVVDEARELGLTVTVWTVNDRAALRWLAGLDVAAVITDDVLVAWSELDCTAAVALAA